MKRSKHVSQLACQAHVFETQSTVLNATWTSTRITSKVSTIDKPTSASWRSMHVPDQPPTWLRGFPDCGGFEQNNWGSDIGQLFRPRAYKYAIPAQFVCTNLGLRTPGSTCSLIVKTNDHVLSSSPYATIATGLSIS